MDSVGPLVAIGLKQLDKPVALDPFALSQLPRQLADPKWRQDALGGRIGRGDQQLRAAALGLKLCEGRQPLGHYP